MRSTSLALIGIVLSFTVVASADQIFSDNFDDGDLSGWTPKQGQWTVGGGTDKYLSSDLNYGVIWNDGSFGTNQKVQVDAFFDLGSSNGNLKLGQLRVRTGENGTGGNRFWDTGYLATFRADRIDIQNTFLGGNPTIASHSFASDLITSSSWHTLGFEVTGTGSDTNFKALIDNVLYIDTVYNNNIAQLDSGYVGLGNMTQYDNFESSTDVVQAPLPGAVLLGAIGLGIAGVGLQRKRRAV